MDQYGKFKTLLKTLVIDIAACVATAIITVVAILCIKFAFNYINRADFSNFSGRHRVEYIENIDGKDTFYGLKQTFMLDDIALQTNTLLHKMDKSHILFFSNHDDSVSHISFTHVADFYADKYYDFGAKMWFTAKNYHEIYAQLEDILVPYLKSEEEQNGFIVLDFK